MITPLILTFDEDQNIEATLKALTWARRIVVLDSGSTDRTEEIARSFKNVSWFVRPFDNHCSQWSYALHHTSVSTDYVLALDADMRPGLGFERELDTFLSSQNYAGAWVPFEYRMLGQALTGSLYPAQLRIFRKETVRIEQPGHTQVFTVEGELYRFRSGLVHEDRKPISRWLQNQANYAALEASRIRSGPKSRFKDRLRRAGIGPWVWGAYAYVRAGGPLRSPAARAYSYERMIFEAILARLLTE